MLTTKKQQELIFTSRAAERIVYGTTNYRISDLYLDSGAKKVVVQVARSNRLIVLDVRDFIANFIETRIEKAKKLKIVRQTDICYIVYNPQNSHSYGVTSHGDRLVCECQDYQNQVEAWGKGCCKHGYKVLNHLGFDKLADYIKANEVQPVSA